MKDEGKSLELGAVSSVVEHYLDTVGVTGSNPVSRTIFFPHITTCALSSKTNASILTLFCLDGRIEGQASDVVFADDDGCVFVRSEKCRGVTCNRPEIWGRQKEAIKAGRALRAQLDFACYLQKRTGTPVTFRDHLRNLDGVIEETDFS